MKLYTTERLSPRKERTPEGFLVCYDVPIARTGYQKYLPQELTANGVPAGAYRTGDGGLVDVYRPPAEVFRDATFDPGPWQDPANWGMMLVDLAQHIANAYDQTKQMDRVTALAR